MARTFGIVVFLQDPSQRVPEISTGIWHSILQHPLPSEADLANEFRHRRHPEEGFIGSLRLPSWPATLILTLLKLVVTCDSSMTPLKIERHQNLGIDALYNVEELSIAIFFYGASSSPVEYGPFTSSIKGVFVVLFSASVVIFVFVLSFLRVAYFLTRPDPPRFHRRRRFSDRWAAAMFVVTVINFLLFGLSAGNEIAKFAMFIRKDLIEDPLLKKQESENALQNLMIVQFWSANLPVSNNLSLLDPVSIHVRWRCYSAISLSFGGLGSSSNLKIDNG